VKVESSEGCGVSGLDSGGGCDDGRGRKWCEVGLVVVGTAVGSWARR
jgi:hypothetical protein